MNKLYYKGKEVKPKVNRREISTSLFVKRSVNLKKP